MISTIGAFTMAVGMLVFVVNVVKTTRTGRRAVNDPWIGRHARVVRDLAAAAVELRPDPVHHQRAPAARPAPAARAGAAAVTTSGPWARLLAAGAVGGTGPRGRLGRGGLAHGAPRARRRSRCRRSSGCSCSPGSRRGACCRRRSPRSCSSALAALLTAPRLHLAAAALAFAATSLARRPGLPRRSGPGRRGARLRHADEAAGDVAAPADGRRGGVRRRRRRAAVGHLRRDDGRARARLRRRGGAQPLPRPRHRQADGLADGGPAGGGGPDRAGAGARVRDRALGALVRPARLAREPADRAARARREPLLRPRLHALAQALDAAEHRHRRRRRRRAAARRLRGHGRPPRLGRARDVRDRLPLDAAALLGARADDPRPLRERATCRCCPSCAASARRRARSRGTRSRSSRRRSLPVAFGVFGLVYGVSALVLGAIFSWMAFALWRADDAPARGEALPLLDALPGAALRRDGDRRGRPWHAQPPSRHPT